MLDHEDPLVFVKDVENGLNYGALITDISMPQMSGVSLVHRLEALGVMRPTVFVSGFSSEPLDLAAFRCQAYVFIPKPFDRGALLSAIDDCRSGFRA